MRLHPVITYTLALATAVVLSGACAKERFDVPAPEDGTAIALGSFRKQVLTRSGGDLLSFNEGTKYALAAVEHADEPADYAWDTDRGFDAFPTVGTETARHTIAYSPVSVFPQGTELDFFGLTYGNGTAPALDAGAADGVDPEITVAEEAGKLPDLMHSNTVRRRKASDGIVMLPFEHALASVRFLVAKQDESGDGRAERQLERVRVTGVRIENAATRATMDLVTGDWRWSAADVGTRAVWQDPAGIAPGTEPQRIGTEDFLLFPNSDGDDENNAYYPADPFRYRDASNDESAEGGEQLIVSVTVEGLETYDIASDSYVPLTKTLVDGTEVVDGRCEVRCPVRAYDNENGNGRDKGPLLLRRNMKYTLSILILRDNVRIITVSPQVYEWVDIDLSNEAQLMGQPVVFGGLMWLDRNLGASSADCQHDWWHSCGYFYQFGRNIPYMYNLEAILDEDGLSEKPGIMYKPWETSDAGQAGQAGHAFHIDQMTPFLKGTFWNDNKGIYLIYTYDQYGRKCYEWYDGKDYIYEPDLSARTLTNRTYVAINPGEDGYYGMILGKDNFTGYARTPSGALAASNGTYWLDPADPKKGNPANQPVPKGWRMPTRADGYRILPEPAQSSRSWMSYAAYLFQGRISDLDENISGDVNKLRYVLGDDNYRFQYVRGRIKVDPNAVPDADGLTAISVSRSPNDGEEDAPTIYGIKRQGTPEAYRILIRRMQSNIDGRYFLRISQFASDETEVFRTNVDKTGLRNTKALSYNGTAVTRWNLHEFDWKHPAAVLDFPLQGYIDGGGNSYYDYPFLNQVGIATIMRLPEYQTNATSGYNWTFYMRNATSGVAVGAGSRRSIGDCIRLVRDLEAND